MTYAAALLKRGDAHYQAEKYWDALNAYSWYLRENAHDPNAYVKKGDCLRELKIYDEALHCYEQALTLDPQLDSAYIGKADAYASCGEIESALALYLKIGETFLNQGLSGKLSALEVFEKAIRLNSHIAQAHAGKGHALYALNRRQEAFSAYEYAIIHHTDDAHCYSNSGEILAKLGRYEDAYQMFERALQLAPDLVAAHAGRGSVLFELHRYVEALTAYQQVVVLDENNLVAHVSIGDIQTLLSSFVEADAAYGKAFALIQREHPLDHFWLLTNPARAPFRPLDIQLELLCQFIIRSPHNPHIKIALKGIYEFYAHCFDPEGMSTDALQENIRKLAMLLESLSEESRSEALLQVTGGDNIRTLQLLIALEPFTIGGLRSLAYELTLQVTPEPRTDDLFVRFYHVLDSYGVPFEDSDWLFCQALMAERLYLHARSILVDLVKRRPAPDVIWLLAQALEKLNQSPEEQVKTLQRFVKVASPSDERYGLAWKRIGELYEQRLQNGIEAMNAYQQAEKFKFTFQQLNDFRSGHWEAVPVLHSHPDYAFPAVIVIDLESEYKPESPSDPTIYEVGAMCVKGSTQLGTYHALIRCDARKMAHRQHEAEPLEDVMKGLRKFIECSQHSVENAIIVGHNIQEFDAPYLREMGLPIRNDQILDTLAFARLLYPDSLRHNLSLLCERHSIPLEEAHQALPDAQACARVLHALGNELLARGERLLAGFRAFVQPGSAFDRVVLQPRKQGACPGYTWELDPVPSRPSVLVTSNASQPSPKVLEALHSGSDALVERFDPEAAYAGYLPTSRKTVVTAATRTRLERMLAAACERSDLYVLPDARTLLCPHHLRKCIEREEDSRIKLALFCLYQASHNHDASTLYPLRLPQQTAQVSPIEANAPETKRENEIFLSKLREILLEACCASDWGHADDCPARLAASQAVETSALVLATHEIFLQQAHRLTGGLLIIDDIDDLQMHFAEYLAERVSDQEVLHWSQEVYAQLAASISSYLDHIASKHHFHERLPLSRLASHFTEPQDGSQKSLLALLRGGSTAGSAVADMLERFYQASLQEVNEAGCVHAYWLDLRFADSAEGSHSIVESWSFCGLSRNLQEAFHEMCWQPFRQHILCGTAVALGTEQTQFLRRFYNISERVAFLADERPPCRMYIPTAEVIRPSSFLGRRAWAESAGAFLYRLALSFEQSLVVTLPSTTIADALSGAFYAHSEQVRRQVLSPKLKWTTAKIAERLARESYATLTFISPFLRRSVLYDPVSVEVTGPLRFLNQRDPLVAAHVRAFSQMDAASGSFSSYILPQALLEVKARLSSQADLHIILDSALRDAVYRDEVLDLFKDGELLETLPDVPLEAQVPDAFVEALAGELEKRGLSSRLDVSEEDLQEVLRVYWQTKEFRTSPLDQKAVVRSVLEGKDQLVIAATGGGKSLCFQLPAILLSQDVVPKVTLVISPLIALMRDQITSLRCRGIFAAAVLDSLLSPWEREHVLQGIKCGDFSILYIAPEQIHSPALFRALRRREIGLIAIDEAHCVSQWGHNFRTDYFTLKKWIDHDICEEHRRAFPLLALTATARRGYVAPDRKTLEKATVEDIVERLGLRLAPVDVKLTSPERPELAFRVVHISLPCLNCQKPSVRGPGEVRCESCRQPFSVTKEEIRQAKLRILIRLLDASEDGGLRQRWDQPPGKRQRGIVYCRTVDETWNIREEIQSALPGLRVHVYNGPQRREERDLVYQRFMSDAEDGLDIVVATSAFGMGIDARRLGFVIHFDVPATLEAYYQEAGRAGRDPSFQSDGERAQCILLYHESDLESQRWLLGSNRITPQDIESVYVALYKLKGARQQEVLVTAGEIELLSGVDADKVGNCLFYLEYHTGVKGAPVLQRRENAQKLWQLKFEQGYQERLSDPVLHPLSKHLAEVFCSSPDFRLNEEQMVIIDAVELAAHLHWELSALEDEKNNLVKRHILAFASPVYIKWHKNLEDSRVVVLRLMQDMRTLINSVDNSNALFHGEYAKVCIQNLYDEGLLAAVPPATLTLILSQLAQREAGEFQVFEEFKKAVDAPGQQCFRLRLKLPQHFSDVITEVMNSLQHLRKALLQTAQRFGQAAVADEWRYIDLLTEEPDYEARQRLKSILRWFSILGFLSFPEERLRETVMRLDLLQDIASPDDLEIDLTSLRLLERHGERKLALMREYALASEEQRRQLLRAYFFGETPLIEPFVPHPDLTEEQQALVKLSSGYHLIQGPAGSGKTTLLQEHFRYLVEQLLVPVDRILITAHFHSALDRMGNHLNSLQRRGKVISSKTLHSLGEAIFRQHRQLLLRVDGQLFFPEEKAIRLLKGQWNDVEEQETELVSRALHALYRKKEMQVFLPANMEWPLASGSYKQDSATERECLNAISLLRSLGIFHNSISSGEDLRAAIESMASGNSWVLNNLPFYYAAYLSFQFVQSELGLYTHDDQILFALAILRANPEVAKRWQRKYEHIIIDEFQDFTPAGAELIGILSRKQHNVLAVGDPRQHILTNQKEPVPLSEAFQFVSDDTLVQEHRLTSNFRSVQEILDFAHALLQPFEWNKQVAKRGVRGIKPTVILVHPGALLAPTGGEDADKVVLEAMVDAALHHMRLLPSEDAGSIGFLVARSNLSYPVQLCLKRRNEPFAVLENKHRYQSYHVQRVLSYFRLIQDSSQMSEAEFLLRHCISPYFKTGQIMKLKEIARISGKTLLEAAVERDAIERIGVTAEHVTVLRQHLAVLERHTLDSNCKVVWQSIREIQDCQDLQREEQAQAEEPAEEIREIEEVMEEFQKMTVRQALEHIDGYITFLENNRNQRKLVVATINNAKSQDFDTVFLLRADALRDRRRWYVSITRARQRFFCLVNVEKAGDGGRADILSSLSSNLYEEICWPEAGSTTGSILQRR